MKPGFPSHVTWCHAVHVTCSCSCMSRHLNMFYVCVLFKWWVGGTSPRFVCPSPLCSRPKRKRREGGSWVLARETGQHWCTMRVYPLAWKSDTTHDPRVPLATSFKKSVSASFRGFALVRVAVWHVLSCMFTFVFFLCKFLITRIFGTWTWFHAPLKYGHKLAVGPKGP